MVRRLGEEGIYALGCPLFLKITTLFVHHSFLKNMSKRYSNTERLGVNAAERIVINELVWIFREQPIVDVGVDVLIEQSEDGNPKGKFLAAQIKTGKSHFSLSKDKLTYYPSNVHYNYWLSLDIPIILIAHLPDNNETYWQHISSDNIKKTRSNGHKIEIPKKQEFNKESKEKLTRILSKRGKKSITVDLYEGRMTSESIFDASENIDFMSETSLCIDNIRELGDAFRERHLILYDNLAKAFDINELNLKAYKIRSIIKVFAKKIDIYSERFEREIHLFSKCHATGFYACEHNTLFNYSISLDKDEIESIIISLTSLHDSAKGISEFVNSIQLEELDLPEEHSVLREANLIFKNAVLRFDETRKLITTEFYAGNTIIIEIIERLEDIVNSINKGQNIGLPPPSDILQYIESC